MRESIRHPGDYVLCVSFAGEVIHYRVIYQHNKLTIDNSQFFYNLIDMIEVGAQIFMLSAVMTCFLCFPWGSQFTVEKSYI